MTAITRFSFFLLTVAVVTNLQAKPAAPEWVTTVVAKPASFDYGKANAAVLLDEQVIDVDSSGTFLTRTRKIVRILTKDGKDEATAVVLFTKSAEKVKSLQAWLIPTKGNTTILGSKDTIETALQENTELYSDARQMFISARDEANAGCVFAYEAVVESKGVSTFNSYYFQDSIPVEHSAITYNLPPGWRVESRTFNHAPITPVIKERSTTWEMHSLPTVKNEPLCPPAKASMIWIGLDLHPPAGAKTIRQAFSTWQDISTYFTPKYDASSTPDAALKAKADALTAGAKTLWDRIYPLCRLAQKVNYISINLNLSHAGGYIPRDACKVLQSNYGDCKDKASFLRALLRTQGIESFPLIVNSGGGRYVAPDWPSPSQFNHAILAIKVDDTINTPAVMVHPVHGRLLIFDGTNPYTPPGLLPDEDCGGRGLLVAGPQGELITLPDYRPKDNFTERKITAKLQASGAIDGTIEDNYHDLASTTERHYFRSLSQADYRKYIEHWVNASMPVARLEKIVPTDDLDKANFLLSIQFNAPSHGKPMRDVLLIFKPVLIPRSTASSLKKEKRHQPIVLESESFSEKSIIELPTEFHIDELPAPVELKSNFGHYTASVKACDGQKVIVERSLELSLATIPAAEYESVRSFFEKMVQAEQAPVVLRKN